MAAILSRLLCVIDLLGGQNLEGSFYIPYQISYPNREKYDFIQF